MEHYKNCDVQDVKTSWMKKHIVEEHEGKQSDFVWNVIKGFRKPLTRQLTEAVCIKETDKNEVMNLKTEYFSNETNGVTLNKKEYTCKGCGKS